VPKFSEKNEMLSKSCIKYQRGLKKFLRKPSFLGIKDIDVLVIIAGSLI
jgi:hypothetical protein